MRYGIQKLAGAACAIVLACGGPADAAPRRAPTYTPEVINPDLNAGLVVPESRVLLAWGTDGAILRSEDGVRWTHAQTQVSVDLARIASNPAGTTLVAVGARGTILRSTDAGKSWPPARVAPTDTDLKAVVHHAASGAWIAAGTNGRLLRSADDGKSWQAIDSKLTVGFQALFVDPRTQSILLGGDEGAIGISSDAGVSWTLTLIEMPAPATPIIAFKRYGTRLLASSALGRFLISEDDAGSWDLLQATTNAFITDSAFDPRRGAIVMTGHNGDVLRSPDGGVAWEVVEVTIDGHKSYLAAVAFDECSESLIAVGQGGLIVRSTDGGATWSRASSDVTAGMRALLADPRGRLVALGAGGLVVTSTDSGQHWIHARNALEFDLREVASTPRGNALVATSKLGDIIHSADGGASWRPLSLRYTDPNTPPDLRALVVAPRGDALIAAGPPGAILRSNPDGDAWEVEHWTPLESERALPWLLVDRSRDIVVAVEARGAMQVSRGGEPWQIASAPAPDAPFPFWHGALLERTGVIVVAGKSGAIVRSADGARTWSPIDTGMRADLFGSYADERAGLLFLMGQEGTLLRSHDLGQTWQQISSGSGNELRRMVREPRTGALICYGAHGTILRSQDDGLTWRPAKSATDGVLRKAVFEPGTGNLVLVGGQGAILRSTDGGKNWGPLTAHTSRHFTSIVADEASGNLIVVGERIVRLVRESNQ